MSSVYALLLLLVVQGLMSAAQYVEQSTHTALAEAAERFPDYPLLITGMPGRVIMSAVSIQFCKRSMTSSNGVETLDMQSLAVTPIGSGWTHMSSILCCKV
jgi:hypothetical protein